MESYVLLSILMLSTLLVTIHGHDPGKCPSVKEKCKFKERNECLKDSQCQPNQKCCEFSCGRKCLDLRKDVCSLPKVSGPCFAYFHRWWYNKKIKQCTGFIFGGCKGNANNFQTKDICQSYCLPKH